MALAKVVRVEEFATGVHFDDNNQLELLREGEEPGKHVPTKPAIAERDGRDTGDCTSLVATSNAGDEEIPSEAGDVLPPLPEGWPRLPRVFQRGSWDFSTSVSPSINKATAHLELLQNILEQWCQEERGALRSRAASSTITRSGTSTAGSPSKRELHFQSTPCPSQAQDGPLRSYLHSALSRVTGTTAVTSSTGGATELAVRGIGGKAGKNSSSAEETGESPYLGVEEVIDEVILLLARLETDRQDTLKNLQKERDRVKSLSGKIDNYAEQRRTELPAAVQREHEACALDIYELNWHVNYRNRNEGRIKGKVDVAQVLNTRLKEDISFVTKHVPLVQEKLDLEQEAMARIQRAQTDTDDELGVTLERCARVEGKSGEAHSKAAEERAAIKHDLDTVKTDLSKISEDLAQAKMTYTSYIHQCNDYRQQLKDNEQELLVLQVKCENAKTNEAMANTKVKDLHTKITKEEHEHRRLQDGITRMEEDLSKNEGTHATMEQDMNAAILSKQEKLKILKRTNKELDMDIEDFEGKIKNCVKQKSADEKNVERMIKEMGRTEQQIEVTLEDLANVTIINTATRESLNKQEEKCIHAEEALKATVDALRKQVKEELHSKTVMASRINSDETDLTKNHADTKQKKEKVEKKADEVKQAVQTVLNKVVKLRSAHAEKAKAIDTLKSELDLLEKQKKETEEACRAKTQEMKPHHTHLKEQVLVLDKQLDHMAWKTEMMTKKMEDMDASANMINKAHDNTERTIIRLQDELEELLMQTKSSQHLEDDLRISLNSLTARMRDKRKKQEELMKERTGVLDRHQTDLKEELSKNTLLASQYRRLQNQFIHVKNQLLNEYDERVKVEAAIKDVKQLSGLQKRMHTAMLAYLRYRSLYNGSELQRMEGESKHNGVKVSHLQTQMDGALDTISDFLQNQLDGDTIRRMAMEKVDKEERETTQATLNAPPTSRGGATLPGLSREKRSRQLARATREGTRPGLGSRQSTQATKPVAAH